VNSVVRTMTGLEAGRSGFRIPAKARNVLVLKTFRPALRPTQLPIQWVSGLIL